MNKAIRLFCAMTLLFATACGQQDKQVAEGAVDSDTVLVNRVQEIENENGKTEYYGEVGIVHNANYVNDLNKMVEEGDVEFMTEEELAQAGVNFSNNSSESQLTQAAVWPFALVFGIIIGAMLEDNDDDCNCYPDVEYRGRSMTRRSTFSYYNYPTYTTRTYRVRRNNRRNTTRVVYRTSYWY